MTYEETLQFLYAKLPMYQRIGASAFKKDLTNILLLSKHLGDKHLKVPTIHVAGTNGKGSVSHMLASVLQEAGYKTGLYTSPHLKDFRERIRINGEMVSKDFVVEFTRRVMPLIDSIAPSFFEITVAMAFEAFAEEAVDIAVIETGLGGRLDSTNIITPVLSVITNIDYDHTDMLGNTLELIATEKAGIIKPFVPVVIGETHPETAPVFNRFAGLNQSPITYADQTGTDPSLFSDLGGRFQLINRRTVLVAIKELQKAGWDISGQQIQRGMQHVVKNTGLRGRWEKLMDAPDVFCDTAHNKAGISKVIENLKELKYDTLHIVFGAAEGKEIAESIRMFPKAVFYLCRPDVPRGMSVEKLAAIFDQNGLSYLAFDSVPEAFRSAIGKAGKKDLVFVGGSTFVVADLLTYLED